MRLARLKLAILAIACSAAPSLAGDVTVTSRNCAWCHGTSVQGFASAPRLAGQRPAYTMNQLRDFRDHTRDNPRSQQYMWGATEGLSFHTARNLAAYFSTLYPKAAGDGYIALAAAGRAIYEEGFPEFNIVSCAACHGPNGEGIRQIPRLGGLSYDYLKRRLEEWGEGYHSAAEFPMPGIARKLSPNEIEALASYLSFVR